jgi:3-phosphoshikimate 1-carboxyvinyltransferase
MSATTGGRSAALVERSGALRGTIRVPGDKSITHRALFFGAINRAGTTIRDASPAADCARSVDLVEAIGRTIARDGDALAIASDERRGSRGELTIDCGNSGTTARLAMGLLSAEPGTFTLVGDPSLERRPMERVAAPLRMLGASIATSDGRLPATINGRVLDGGASHGLITVVSAQVHAALVLAALRSHSGATIYAARPMRDHTLRMLRRFTAPPHVSDSGVHRILPASIDRQVIVDVPGDFSSAAFLVAAAVLVPGSDITIDHVGLNPTRIAFLRALRQMGADVTSVIEGGDDDDDEPFGTISARYSPELRSGSFDGSTDSTPIGEMIDELPLLALVATQAHGTTIVRDARELRVKESDRIAATAATLRALGARVTELEDGFAIEGGQTLSGGGDVEPSGDHRLAMMAAVGAMIAERGARVVDADVVDVSYARFWDDLKCLGGAVTTI